MPIYVLIYGIKNTAKSDLDFTIYDYEKAYEIINNKLEVHIPIDMNGNELLGLPPDLNQPYDVIDNKLTLYIPIDMNGHFHFHHIIYMDILTLMHKTKRSP